MIRFFLILNKWNNIFLIILFSGAKLLKSKRQFSKSLFLYKPYWMQIL